MLEWLGKIAYIINFPLLFLILNGSKRTRVVVSVGNEVLVLRPHLGLGTYILPGGGIKKAELPAQSAARELREETGIEVRTDDLVYIGEFSSRHNLISVRLHVFHIALPKKPEVIVQKHEIAQARWMENSRLSEIPMISAEKRVIARLFA